MVNGSGTGRGRRFSGRIEISLNDVGAFWLFVASDLGIE